MDNKGAKLFILDEKKRVIIKWAYNILVWAFRY
jgi:hypothetical protein